MQLKTRKAIGTIGYAEANMSPDNCVRVGDRLLPKQIDVTLPGVGGQPQLTARLELVDKVPQCRQITIASVDGGREVKQLDLRGLSIVDMVEGIYAGFSMKIIREEDGFIMTAEGTGEIAYVEAMRDIAAARKGKGARKITDDFLAEVAEIYKQNISGNPTQAVQRAFDVSPRMAAEYISRARRADPPLLPPTTPGKKRA